MYNPPKLIGLIGYAGSGKTAVATRLAEIKGWEVIAFADTLKEMARDTRPDLFAGDLEEEKRSNPEIREYLQRLGQAVREHLHPDVWVDEVDCKVLTSDVDVVIVPDVRYLNEAEYIYRNGGKLLRITRPGYGPVNAHHSETELDSLECPRFLNNGTIGECVSKIEKYLTAGGFVR